MILLGPLILRASETRALEANASAALLRAFGQDGAYAAGSYIVLGDPHDMLSIEVTPDCGVLIIAVPLVLAASVMLFSTRAKTWHIITALLVSLIIVVSTNILRLSLVASSTWVGGDSAYEFTHVLVGSLFSIASSCLALFVLIRYGLRPGEEH